MNQQEIEVFFLRHIAQRSAIKVFGVSKETVSRIRREGTTLGTMLSMLLKAGLITVTANESTGTTE